MYWDTNADFEKITELELNSSVGGPRTIAPQWPGYKTDRRGGDWRGG